MRGFLVAAAIAGLWAGAASAADPVEGVWMSEPGENGNYELVEFTQCGAKICGTLVKSFNRSGVMLATGDEGRQIIWDMKAVGGGRYKGGQMSLPDNGERPGGDADRGSEEPLAARMQLSGDKLSISGCFMGGLICGGQTWARVK